MEIKSKFVYNKFVSVSLVGAHGVVEMLLRLPAAGCLVAAALHFLHLALSQHFADTLGHHLLFFGVLVYLLLLASHAVAVLGPHPRALRLLGRLHVSLVRHW